MLLRCMLPAVAVVCLLNLSIANAALPAATVSQRLLPVLIGNDLNALLQITIDVEESGIVATAFTFSLDGCDDLNDVDALRLFYSGQTAPEKLDAFRRGAGSAAERHKALSDLTGQPFGELTTPARAVTFRGKQTLNRGRNIFWLSCRLRVAASLTNRINVSCRVLETSAGQVTPKSQSVSVPRRIGIALRNHYDDGVHTSRIPALTVTPQGTLLCAYDMRRRKGRDLQEDIDIGLNRSSDGGHTWEPVRVIMDMGEYGGLGQDLNGCSDPGLVVDRETGEIFCTAVWMWDKAGEHQWRGLGSEPGHQIGKSAQFLMVRSVDDGRTWSKPENLTKQLKNPDWILLAPSPQNGLTLRDGTLVMPVQGRDEQDVTFSTLVTSRDHGKTWSVGSSQAGGNNECQVVELADGSLMLNGRTTGKTRFRSVWVTRDLGKTWKSHATHRNTLIEPRCNGSLIRFDREAAGKTESLLLFANPYSQTGRDHHSIQVSFDEGQTWPSENRLLLDEGQGAGYPSMVQLDEGHLGIVYEGSQAQLIYEKVSIDELLKGRP
jgi:sialidase-1